jgi:hypothetical protein
VDGHHRRRQCSAQNRGAAGLGRGSHENEASTLHNISIPALGIDKDIPPKGKVLLAIHGPLSMNGQLLTGDAGPSGARDHPHSNRWIRSSTCTDVIRNRVAVYRER